MCGRYVISSKITTIIKRFHLPNLEVDEEVYHAHVPNYNLAPGELGPVITNLQPRRLQLFRFGYTNPNLDKATFVINARSEGYKNKDNDIHYSGGPGIKDHAFWKDAIYQRRCIIFADAFYEGPQKEKLKKPHLCYLINKKRPFAFAGVWSEIPDAKTGEARGTFAILTHVANDVMQQIGHHRSPVILDPQHIQTWLHPEHIADALQLLRPYPGTQMNAYPVSAEAIMLGKAKRNDKEILEPIGQRLFSEREIQEDRTITLQGMGHQKGKREFIQQSQIKADKRDQVFQRLDGKDIN